MTIRTLLSGIAALVAATHISSAQSVIYNSNGFEQPPFIIGALEGQDVANGPWVRTGGAGGATVQSATVASGSQAVRLDRAGQDIRYGVQKSVDNVGLSTSPIVAIDWSMRFDLAGLPPGSFGPYIGVEVYDDSGGPALLAASAGVDATTGELLFQQPGSGFIDVVPGIVVSGGSWNDYRLELNYSTLSYSLFLNGTPVLTSGFVDAGVTDFTDVNFSALAAAGDSASLNASATGYFDNLLVTQVPEPGTVTLIAAGLGLVGMMRFRRQD